MVDTMRLVWWRCVCVLFTFRFQLSPLASSNVKRTAECVSLSLPVHSLSFDKLYVMPPATIHGNWASNSAKLNYKDLEEVCLQTCSMQAHRRVEYALVLMNRPPAMG